MYIFFHIGSISSPSFVKIHTVRHNLDKVYNLEPPKVRLYQPTKNHAAEIAPRISLALIYLGVIFEHFILSISNKFEGSDSSGTLESCSGIKNEHKICRMM